MADNTSMIGGLFATPELYQQQQDQAALARAVQFAQMDPMQRANTLLGFGGYKAAGGLASALGAQDPMLKLVSTRNQLASQFDTSTASGLIGLSQALRSAGDLQGAAQTAQAALAAREKEATIQAKTAEKLTPEQKNAAALADTVAERGSPEWAKAYQEKLQGLTTKVENQGEFERLLSGLPISDTEKQQLRSQRVAAMLNPDPSGLKGLQAQLANLQAQNLEFQLTQKKDQAAADKQTAITKLAGIENSIDTSLGTAAKALKLAPETFLQATGQSLAQNIPWSDSHSMKNLISSLNSDKAIGTLEELKTQSKTGATGFGALNTRELQLILDKTRALDPSDKMFKENLVTVMEGWQRLRSNAVDSRINLQGKTPQLQELRSLIKKGRAQGWTPEEKAKAEALKSELGV